MKFTPLNALSGAWLVETERHCDKRGYFCETFRADLFSAAVGQKVEFVQENESESAYGTIRGLHYQAGGHAQAKLVRVTEGEILDVAVDLRRWSPTFGRHIAVVLSHANGRQLYVPRGCAHGFAVLSPAARFVYKVDNYWCRESERTLQYDDAALDIAWPIAADKRILSDKDLCGTPLSQAELFTES